MKNSKEDNIVNGLRVPHFITQQRIDDLASHFPSLSSDVWLVTYPRSGTTLTQGMLANILTDNPSTFRHKVVPWPEVGVRGLRYYASLDELRELPTPRCFKSHWTATGHVDPRTSKAKFIHVSRNCPDMVTSYYYQYLNAVDGNHMHDHSWDAFFEQFMEGELRWGSYFDHLSSWYQHHARPNVMHLTYEELLEDPAAAVKRLAAFVEVAVSESDVRRVVHSCEFDVMKSREPEMAHHFRRGRIGDHQHLMSASQKRVLLNKVAEIQGRENKS